jgi:hypothetical protein
LIFATFRSHPLNVSQGNVLLAGGALAVEVSSRDLAAKTALRHGPIGIGKTRRHFEAQRRIGLDG